jgi:hypothetical protein
MLIETFVNVEPSILGSIANDSSNTWMVDDVVFDLVICVTEVKFCHTGIQYLVVCCPQTWMK